MKQKLKRIFEKFIWWSGVITIGIIFGLGIQLVLAWTEPTANPPGGNVEAPINVGSSAQYKSGPLGIGGLLAAFGGFQMSTGAGAGKVLTSDASGLASWQAGGGALSGEVKFFNLSSCPSGWSELTAAQGRYLVGRPSGGTLAGTQGTALSNLENRAVGAHSHDLSISVDGGYCVPEWSGSIGGYEPGSSGGQTGGCAGLGIGSAGNVAGTNAPYIQLLACQKN